MQKMHIFEEIIIMIILELDISTISGRCPQQKIKPATWAVLTIWNNYRPPPPHRAGSSSSAEGA